MALHLIALPRLVNHDAAGNLELGGKILDGLRPYVDYEEVNFPAIHYLSAIPAALGRFLNTTPLYPFNALVWLAVVGSAWACWRILRRHTLRDFPQAVWIIPLGVVCLSVWCYLTLNWGQREHLFMLSFTPWLVMRVLRYQGAEFGWSALLTLGLAAGIGAAIKPYFALIALASEIFLFFSTHRIRLLWGWDVFAVMMVAVVHILFFILQPDVLAAYGVLLERLIEGYGAYGDLSPLEIISSRNMLIHAVVAFLPIAAWIVSPYVRKFIPVLVVAASCSAIMGLFVLIIQAKGWTNHEIPLLWLNSLSWTFAAMWFIKRITERQWASKRLKIVAVFFIVLMISSYYWTSVSRLRRVNNYYYALGEVILTYTMPGDPVLFIDPSIPPMFPLIPGLDRRSASRYAMTHPIVMDHYSQKLPLNSVPPYTQQYLDHLQEDLKRYHPNLVFVRSSQCEAACESGVIDIHAYLDDVGFLDTTILSNYDLLSVDNGFHIYVRKGIAPNP